MLIQVKYPMPSIEHHIWSNNNILLSDINTLQWETEQHFQRRYASTELQFMEWLALEIVKEYAIWLGMTQVITSQREINKWTRNMKFNLECSEHLVFKLFLVTMMQNINVWTHLAPAGHN